MAKPESVTRGIIFDLVTVNREMRQDHAYVRLREFGGLRHSRRDLVKMGWHNASLRSFADHMQTSEFEAGPSGSSGWSHADVRGPVHCRLKGPGLGPSISLSSPMSNSAVQSWML